MPEIEARPVLPKMINELITAACPNPSDKQCATLYPTSRWRILEKLSEASVPVTQKDFNIGMHPAYVAGKYLCRRSGTEDIAFMRIYKQVPLSGTELDSSDDRKAQAWKSRDYVELSALKYFTANNFTTTPKLLGYHASTQEETDLVPGGYILYLVWEKVAGDPLDIQKFWNLSRGKRDVVRANLRKAYMDVLKVGYQPVPASPSKIILDMKTGAVKISGFRSAARIPPEMKWKDSYFVMFFLVLDSPKDDEYLPTMAKDVEFGEHGWRCANCQKVDQLASQLADLTRHNGQPNPLANDPGWSRDSELNSTDIAALLDAASDPSNGLDPVRAFK
ncbi:uncharacterized protein N7518_000669 [Penicillium psychrosexuale]|uniref:uncharacterized protein n=1 Tax=Penicillium psychrosexuale TaxID=1002107 RepID=UPI0025453505|nr:uncharacterized protein N7518_000669 [Penicillium psychrosexuale]KAJ5804366.1 hypothetical protein N7518_000669 [Penicillium psychrosexuale]